MRVEEALVAHLRATAAVVALVGNRIFRGKVPDAAADLFPRIVYRRTSDAGDPVLRTVETNDMTCRITVDCHGRDDDSGYASARDVADAVEDADGGDAAGPGLRNYVARFLPPPPASPALWIQSCQVSDRRADEIEPQAGGEAKPIFTATVELTIRYFAG